jgi:hypothetical protein
LLHTNTHTWLLEVNIYFHVPFFDGSNYGFWKTRMKVFLKSIDSWQIVKTGWTPPETTISDWTIPQRYICVVNDKAMNTICQALSPLKFLRISHCEIAKES